MLLYRLIIFIYSIKNISLKKIKKDKFLFKDINNNIITKKVIFNNVYGNYNYFLNSKKEFNEPDNNDNSKVFNQLKNGEQIFIDFEKISFIFLLFGFFIIIYGGYYYQLTLIVHFNLFLYYILILILPESNSDDRIYQYILLFSFVSGLIIYAIINTNDKSSKKFVILKIIYGFISGCFLHKIIFYYLYYFDNINNKENVDEIYCCVFVSFILIFGAISCFIPDDYVFFFCSTISGSFYIIKFIDYIIAPKNENDNENIAITSIIIQSIIIIVSIFLQIYHKKYKNSENPNNIIEDIIEVDSARISMASNTSNYNSQNIEIKKDVDEKQKLLLEQKSYEGEVEEEEINDQED